MGSPKQRSATARTSAPRGDPVDELQVDRALPVPRDRVEAPARAQAALVRGGRVAHGSADRAREGGGVAGLEERHVAVAEVALHDGQARRHRRQAHVDVLEQLDR
jgi:hypothetical protein